MNEYPTDEDLKKITDWRVIEPEEFHAFMDFVKSIWWMPDWGFRREGDVYFLSTGGWSGNEDVIGAMRENFFLWSLFWHSHRRGGHFIFGRDYEEVEKILADNYQKKA